MRTINESKNNHTINTAFSPTVMLDSGFATERNPKELKMGAKERSEYRRNSNLYTLKYLDSYAETVYKINGHTVCVCDTDMFLVEVSHIKTYLGKHITNILFNELQKNKPIYINSDDKKNFIALSNDENYLEFSEQYIQPIAKDGVVVGGILILTKKSERYDNKHIDNKEIKAAEDQAKNLSSIIQLK